MAMQPNILKIDSQYINTDGDDSNSTYTFRKTQQGTGESLEFKHRDGRRWHSGEEDTYALPNDETEGERLDRQHQMFRMFFDGSLYLVPMTSHTSKRVLDIGTGTGIWAIECAEEYPNAEVVGLDISAIQPANKPSNCNFVTADVEKAWPYSANDPKFTYIHARLLFMGIHDWKQFFKRCYDSLEPGGWFEGLEFQFPVHVCDEDPVKTTPFTDYTAKIREAGLKAGITGYLSDEFAGILRDVGFEEVQRLDYQIPVGLWAEGAKYKSTGPWMEKNCTEVLPAMAPLVQRHLGYTKEEVDNMVKVALEDMKTSHIYGPFICHIARKPFSKTG